MRISDWSSDVCSSYLIWHAAEARLYWVDIDARKIHRTDPATGVDEVMELTEQVGCIAPRAQGGLIAALENGCALIDAWGAAPRAFGPAVLADKPEQRFNDGRVDALGRLWVEIGSASCRARVCQYV